MNTFVLRELIEYEYVRYYSVQMEGRPLVEYADFKRRMSQHPKTNALLREITSQMRIMGSHTGALPHYFRDESYKDGDARALPPKISSGKVRLYCQRISSHIVVLFNGDYKTIREARDCPQVAPHFLLANRLSTAINKALEQGYLGMDAAMTYLDPDPDNPLSL